MDSPYRYQNSRGGHDLTPEGWAKAAEIAQSLAKKTHDVAEAVQLFGRDSSQFISAHKAWQQEIQRALVFYMRGELPN